MLIAVWFGMIFSLLLPGASYSLGDGAFQNRSDPKQAISALSIYRKYVEKNPEDGHALWRVAMACQFIGMRIAKSSEEKEKLFLEGRDAGERSISLIPNCAPCYFWTAINQALYADSVGIFKMLFSLGAIREKLEKSSSIDPSYAFAGAYRVLGIIDRRVPGIFGGDDDRAKEYFEKAVKAAPGNPINYLNLGNWYLEKAESPVEADRIFRSALGFPMPRPEEVESFESYREIQERLPQLQSQIALATQSH